MVDWVVPISWVYFFYYIKALLRNLRETFKVRGGPQIIVPILNYRYSQSVGSLVPQVHNSTCVGIWKNWTVPGTYFLYNPKSRTLNLLPPSLFALHNRCFVVRAIHVSTNQPGSPALQLINDGKPSTKGQSQEIFKLVFFNQTTQVSLIKAGSARYLGTGT